MNATYALPPEVDAYIEAVRAELLDLPATERDDLLADVEASVAEAASERGGSIAAHLGQPADFAAELRSAAGLAPRPSSLHTPARPTWRATLPGALADPRVAAARRLVAELAPIWWIARAYVAVAAAALATTVDWTGNPPLVPRYGDRTGVGLTVIAVAVAASLALGLAARRRRSLAPVALAANLVLAVAAIPVAEHASRADVPRTVAYVATPAQELSYRGARVENLYPYSRDGRLLYDVLLYDAFGRPVEVGSRRDDPLRRVPVTASGGLLLNAFPIRYFEPGSRTVARPNAGPRIRVPRVRTPPLRTTGRQPGEAPAR